MDKIKTLFSDKKDVKGKWAAVMNHTRKDRGLELSSFKTRCIKEYEIHEFLVCSPEAAGSNPIDDVCYLGFGEITQGGVVEIGDEVYLGDQLYGEILGFDETHMPNHYNIVIKTDDPKTGKALELNPLDTFSIIMGDNKK